mgnify:CR=1 FL=1
MLKVADFENYTDIFDNRRPKMKDNIFPRTFDKQIVYLKNVINTPDIEVGDYTMYNDFVHDPIDFEKTDNIEKSPEPIRIS